MFVKRCGQSHALEQARIWHETRITDASGRSEIQIRKVAIHSSVSYSQPLHYTSSLMWICHILSQTGDLHPVHYCLHGQTTALQYFWCGPFTALSLRSFITEDVEAGTFWMQPTELGPFPISQNSLKHQSEWQVPTKHFSKYTSMGVVSKALPIINTHTLTHTHGKRLCVYG